MSSSSVGQVPVSQLPLPRASRSCEWVQCPNRSQAELTLQRCSQCKKVFYCGVDCQRKDWSRHKIVQCRPPGNLESKNAEGKEPPKSPSQDLSSLLSVAQDYAALRRSFDHLREMFADLRLQTRHCADFGQMVSKTDPDKAAFILSKLRAYEQEIAEVEKLSVVKEETPKSSLAAQVNTLQKTVDTIQIKITKLLKELSSVLMFAA